jgi:PTS system nitrogen regulatory IIA component
MHITDLVSEDLVIPALHEQTKDGVLRELVDPLAAEYPEIDADQLLAMLWERERLGSTGIAAGVAIPHAKLPGLPKVIGVVGRHRQGVDFASLDGAPTKLFFLLVAPTEAAGQHIKALAQVSRLVKDDGFCERLMSATDRHELYVRIATHDGQS